jgi:transcriptional regulator with PAS, ATPase and Fis domain
VAVNCAAIVETFLEAELFGIEERMASGVRGRRETE